MNIDKNDIKNNLNIKNKLENTFSKEFNDFFIEIGNISKELEYKAYLVGGLVRDLILERDIKNIDIDIAIEGNGINFAKELSKKYSTKLITYDIYGTAKIEIFDKNIDIATTRTEIYPYPASNPEVQFSSIYDDLSRRDFSVNALAVSLNIDDFGNVIDFFNGYQDIQLKTLKILHDKSFIDDPNRIFRAIRFEKKLGFCIDKNTYNLAIQAMETGLFDGFINYRIKEELKIILTNEYKPVESLKRLDELKALRCFGLELKFSKNLEQKLQQTYKFIHILKKQIFIDEWIVYISILLNELQKDNFDKMIKTLMFNKNEEETIINTKKIITEINKYSWENISNSKIYYFCKKYSVETLIYAMVFSNDKYLKKSIFKYLKKLKDIKLEINGNDLKNCGILEGKNIGILLKEILNAKLDNKILNKNDELSFVQSFQKKI